MSNKDNTDTYLNIHSDQFNSWVKEFEDKYKKVEESTNVNNIETFNNSDSEESEIEESEEIQYSEQESSNVFLPENVSENSSSTRLLYRRNIPRIRKSESYVKAPVKNKKNLTLSESSSSEKKSNYKEREIIVEKKGEDIISLKQLNSMIPNFNNRIVKSKNIPENKETEVVNNTSNRKKLGEQALYKFISNRRR